MAIVKMKKLRVMAMASSRDELLAGLQRSGCVQISESADKLSDPEWAGLLGKGGSSIAEKKSELADVNAALSAIKRYSGKKAPLFIKRKAVRERDFLNGSTSKRAKGSVHEVVSLIHELSRLQGDESRILARSLSLQPWKGLDLPLELNGTAHCMFRLGVCPGTPAISEMRSALEKADAAAEIYEISADRMQTYDLLVCHADDMEKAITALRPYNFSVTAFQDIKGTADENLLILDKKLRENRRAQQETIAAIGRKKKDEDAIRLYYDQLTAAESFEANAGKLLTDGVILFFEGWLPAENQEEVGRLLDELNCAWETEDPGKEEFPDVPVKLKNNWFTNPLNMVTEMYALPVYDNVDPNPLMAPFFILFYGIMMADMGYGLLMMLAGWLITRKYRPKGTSGHMFSLAWMCGVSTFIFGALTGSFFSDFLTQTVKLISGGNFALPALFTPLDDTMMILVGCMALGVVHIVTGMAVSLILKLKRGDIAGALWEEVTWWLVFIGIALVATGGTKIVLYVSIAMIVTGSGWNAKGFGKVTAIFGSLYNHVTGYFGDILSYSRLMALMLAGSVISQVFNMIGTIPGNIVFFIVISLIGNALNFALNLLGCYVHDLRLQCLEYFGKFYVDGGKPFRPLTFDTKYVDIQKN